MKLRVLLSVLAVVVVAGTASANLLLNSSFETGTGQGGDLTAATVDNWTKWGGGWWANDAAQDGTWSIKRWENGTGMFQDFTASAGSSYSFSLYGYNNNIEPLTDLTLDLNVEWYDSGDTKIGATILLDQLTGSDPQGAWTLLSATAVAPGSTAYGRYYISTDHATVGGQSLFYDSADVDLTVVPEPTIAGLLGVGAVLFGFLRRKNRR